ncbi:MAG: transglycosylase domain-containing protein [Cellvibrio sp.]|uniref:transglycosylase domain-containing protein n=1 Tax=Cellvibrio sp. TaxID=1965322 RepID=UPI002717809E|nr:transglycosylase domain-containing protein [Cellvibrio sp.]
MKSLWRLLILLAMSFMLLQFYFLIKVVLMMGIAPQSTSFQRSEIWHIVTQQGRLPWRQEWVSYGDVSTQLKRAVIASEDGDFINHDGVEWDAIEQAWQKNAKAQDIADKRLKKATTSNNGATKVVKAPKIIGGSTISQQLAKNLFLSGERTLLRKGEEFLLTQLLELLLSKQRILEIYLNSVEWGEGIFGAEAAAQHYFRKPAKQLTSYESARLAVMLPRPKYYEKQSTSNYLASRAATIVARMTDAEVP